MTATYSAPGSLSAHDDLTEAYTAWAAKGTARIAEYRRLLTLAENCGMSPSEPFPLMWVKRRVGTYRRAVAASMQTLHPVFAAIVSAHFQAVRG